GGSLSTFRGAAYGGLAPDRDYTGKLNDPDGLQQQLTLYHVYYNFCLPHASLRQLLPQLELTKETGSAKQWQPRTPAMAAGLTDHVWTLREVLLFRVPPWPQPAGGVSTQGGRQRHGKVA